MTPAEHAQLPDPRAYYRHLLEAPRSTTSGAQALVRCVFHNDTRPSLGINVETGAYLCFACGAKGGDVVEFHRQLYGLSFREALADLGVEAQKCADRQPAPRPAPKPSRPRELAPWARALWDSTRPLSGDAESYLLTRGCRLPPADGDLRWLPALRHPSGSTGAALVALVTDAVTAKPISLHRTWIRADGTKAPVDPPRLLAKGHAKKRGVIRLWPDEAVTHGLCIAEGIETALAAAHGYQPAWACIDAGNMGAFPSLAGIEALTIVADHDPAGLRGAKQCAARWHAAGREVRIAMPPEGQDLADVAEAAA